MHYNIYPKNSLLEIFLTLYYSKNYKLEIMKKISLVLFLSILTTLSYSQDINTFSKRDTTKPFIMGGYGEPFIGGTQLNGDWGIALGIKGGVTFNRKFGFGPVAKVNIGLWEFEGNNLNFNDSADLELFIGSAGIFLEYIFKMESKIHFSIPLNIMVGGVSIREDGGSGNGKDKDGEVESGGVFILEPAINVDFNVSKFFIPSLHIGYRAVFGSQLYNVTDQDLSGAYFGLGLKFGKF